MELIISPAELAYNNWIQDETPATLMVWFRAELRLNKPASHSFGYHDDDVLLPLLKQVKELAIGLRQARLPTDGQRGSRIQVAHVA